MPQARIVSLCAVTEMDPDRGTVEELTAGLRKYYDYYNNARSHSSLGDRTPAEAYRGHESLRRAA